MEETKLTFERYEKKYLLSPTDYAALRERLDPYIEPDVYPSGMVCSLYYDSEDYRLIRHSIEGPVYKEKLRLRSYNVPGDEDQVFVELKKKFKGIVYKRRLAMPEWRATAWLAREGRPEQESQMTRELDYFLENYRPVPKLYLACDRTAWRGKEDVELRITFDRNIRWRKTMLDLRGGDEGEPLLDEGQVLMEIKLPEAAPMWLARMLSELQLFPVSFSKYGSCYKRHILDDYIKEVVLHV